MPRRTLHMLDINPQRLRTVITSFIVLAAVMLLAGGSLSAATASTAAPTSAAGVAAGTVRVLVAAEPRALNQDIDTGSAANAIRTLVVEDLVESTPANHLPSKAGLVTNWRQVAPLDWRFTVRTTRFSNGEVFDARMAAWNIRYAYSRKTGFTAAYLGQITTARSLGPRTLKVTTKVPVPYLPAVLSRVQVMPRAYIARVGTTAASRAPIGTGPFRFREWIPGRAITLVRNPSYYKTPPKIDGVTFEWARDATTRANLLRTAATDISNDLPPNVTAGSAVRIMKQTSELNIALEFNMHEAPFSDVRLRRAVAHAINREALVRAVFGADGATPYRNVFNPMFKSAGGHGKDYIQYDPNAARALLRQVGDVPAIDFYWPVGRYVRENEVGAVITGMLEAVGFRVNQKPMETGAFGVLLQTDKMPGMHLLGGAVALANEAGSLDSKYKRTSVITYCANGSIDALAARASRMPDGKARDDLYRRIEKILLVTNVCPVPLYLQKDVYGVSNRIRGFQTYASPAQVWYSLQKVTVG